MLRRKPRSLILLVTILSLLLSAFDRLPWPGDPVLPPLHPALKIIKMVEEMDKELYERVLKEVSTRHVTLAPPQDDDPDENYSDSFYNFRPRRIYWDYREYQRLQAKFILDYYATQGYLCEPTLSAMSAAIDTGTMPEGLFDAYMVSAEHGVKTGQKCIPGAIASVSSASTVPPGPPQNPEPNTPISPLTDLE